jgi:hypothetical protein
MLNRFVKHFTNKRLMTWVILILILMLEIVKAPLNRKTRYFLRDTVSVDAISDTGDNQQIVATNG